MDIFFAEPLAAAGAALSGSSLVCKGALGL